MGKVGFRYIVFLLWEIIHEKNQKCLQSLSAHTAHGVITIQNLPFRLISATF